jgi:hypothetical protein
MVGDFEQMKIQKLHQFSVGCAWKILDMCKRKPSGKLHLLRRVLSNKHCGKMMDMFDKILVGAPFFRFELPVQAGAKQSGAPARILAASLPPIKSF